MEKEISLNYEECKRSPLNMKPRYTLSAESYSAYGDLYIVLRCTVRDGILYFILTNDD